MHFEKVGELPGLLQVTDPEGYRKSGQRESVAERQSVVETECTLGHGPNQVDGRIDMTFEPERPCKDCAHRNLAVDLQRRVGAQTNESLRRVERALRQLSGFLMLAEMMRG